MTMEEKRGNEIREQAHIVFVITVTAFSLILILLNVLLGWEKWTIPLCVVAILACITMHITHSPQEHLRIYIYAIIFMIEIFFYSVNVDTIYDSTPVIVIAKSTPIFEVASIQLNTSLLLPASCRTLYRVPLSLVLSAPFHSILVNV